MTPDDTLTLYGELEISLDDDGCIRIVDEANEYECTLEPEEFDEFVDYVNEVRLQRKN